MEGIGQEDTEDLPGRGSSLHRPRNAGVGALQAARRHSWWGLRRRMGLRWYVGGHAEGQSRPLRMLRKRVRGSIGCHFTRVTLAAVEEQPWGLMAGTK